MKAEVRDNTSFSFNNIKDIFLDSIRKNIRQYTMIIALLSIWIIFSFLTDFIFLTPRNLSNLFLQTVTIAILGIGMVLIIVAGHIDLSVGSIAGFTGAIAAILQVKMGLGTIPAILITILAGVIIGVWQGYWVAYRGVPAFIVTLAGMMVFRGTTIGITQGASIGPMNDSFKILGQGYLPKLIFKNAPFNDSSLVLTIILIIAYIIYEIIKRRSRKKKGLKILPGWFHLSKIVTICLVIAAVFSIMIFYMGISYAVLILLFLAGILTFVANKTTWGRQIYAIGGNEEAARLSGINIKKRTFVLFIVMGSLSSIASCVFTARLNAATASAGNLFELNAIAAAIIGGTSIHGGEGKIYGAVIGALVMASLDNGMSLMNMDVMYQYVIKGLILLLAVWVDIVTRKRKA